MPFEDLEAVREAIDERDAIELWDAGYYDDAKRWIGEAINNLEESCLENAETLRSSMHDYCQCDDGDSIVTIRESAAELADIIAVTVARLERVQEIVRKVENHHFPDEDA